MKLRILTYNTHLCGGSGMTFFGQGGRIAGKGRDGPAQPMTYRDEDRARLICDRIMALSPDIVALQEVWDWGLQKRIRDQLAPAYPYVYAPGDVNPPERQAIRKQVRDNVPGIFRDWLGIEDAVMKKFSGLFVGSGLMLFSKAPQQDCAMLRFAELHGDDAYSTKGVAACTVATAACDLRVGTSHAGTDCGGKKLPHIQEIIYQTCRRPFEVRHQPSTPADYDAFYAERLACAQRRPEPAVMLGDLNVNWVTEHDLYLVMDRYFGSFAGAQDAFRVTIPSASSCERYWHELAQLLTEYRADLQNLCDPGPAVPLDSGRTRHTTIACKDIAIYDGPTMWTCPDCADSADSARIDQFRKRLGDLTAQYGITSDPTANLLAAYLGRRCSLQWLAASDTKDVPGRLDYVYYANPPEAQGAIAPGGPHHLIPEAVTVLTDWGDESLWDKEGGPKIIERPHLGHVDHPKRVDLSDHYPMLATFVLK